MDGMQLIKNNTEFPIALPWNGTTGVFVLRMLNSTQIKACGEFSTIIDVARDDEQPTIEDMIEVKNTQERLMKFCMVNPTYDEALDYLYDSKLIKAIKEKIILSREEIKAVEDVKRAELLAAEVDSYELYLAFLFPEDFMAAITSTILQRDNSDIRKVTKEMLLEAAVLAEKGHDNPSDHLEGVFTDFHKQDIDKHAWIELTRYREEKNVVENVKWTRNTRKRR